MIRIRLRSRSVRYSDATATLQSTGTSTLRPERSDPSEDMVNLSVVYQLTFDETAASCGSVPTDWSTLSNTMRPD
jgi:hypothetical protein